jgi:hypothetical protein
MFLPGLLALGAALAGGPAAAQDPLAEYNRARAYSHFLNSNAPVRSYYGAVPGAEWEYVTPWDYTRSYRSPTYRRELITPFDHEVERGPLWAEKDVVPRPVLIPPPPAGPIYPIPDRR